MYARSVADGSWNSMSGGLVFNLVERNGKMNRFFTVLSKTTLALGLLLMFGCMNVEYVGQSLPELAENEPVKVYSPASQFKEAGYRVLGRVEIQAPDGTTQEDVVDELTRLARKHGAEIANILEIKRVRIGTVAADPGVSRVGWNRDGRNAGGAYIYSNYFGEVSTLEGRRINVTELLIKAVLLVPEEKVRKLQESANKKQDKNADQAK